MKFNQDDLKKLIYDPASTQNYVLDKLEEYYGSKLNIVDPSNPFIFLLEANASINSATLQEFNTNIRKLYPIMATSKEDLYHHLVTSDLTNIFAVPGRAVFGFYINVEKLKANGDSVNNYYKTIIPKYTSINVNNTQFTLMNDIEVKYYNTGQYYIKLIGNENELSSIDTDLIPANLIKNSDGSTWLYFELELQQLKITKYEDIIIPSQPYYKKYHVEDKYVYLSAYTYSNIIKDYTKLDITYSQFYYNPNKPTLYVIAGDNEVITEIPGIYLINNTISKKVITYIYTTKGNIDMNLEKLDINDFSINYSNVDTVGNISSIPIFVKALTNIYGGKDETDFETLKEMVIKHTTGNNDLPITYPEIKNKLSQLGLNVNYTNDTIINRKYTVYKDIDSLGHNVNALMDVYNKEFPIQPNSIDNYYIKKYDDSIILNPFSVFEYNMVDDSIKILTKDEISNLEDNNDIAVINNDDTKKYSYNIYKYIIDTENTISTRAYDINTVLNINNIKNIEINSDINATGFITNRSLYRTEDTYYLRFDIGNIDNLNGINITDFKVQVGLLDSNKTTYFYYDGNIIKDETGIYGLVEIKTDGYIDEDDNIVIIEPLNNVIKTKIPINTDAIMVLYTDIQTTDIKPYENLNNYLYIKTNKIAVYKEEFNINLATRLKYLYTNTNITYTPRKYKTYEEDVYLTYQEDIYKTDEYGIVLEPIDEDNDGTPDDFKPVILHKKGDLVLDDDGNPILLHKKGDIVLDENNNPVIDDVYGITYTTNLLLLDYEFKLANKIDYIEYRQSVYKELTDLSTIVLENINRKLLDNTIVLYKPKDRLNKVKLLVNNIVKTTPLLITPTVTIYSTEYIADANTVNNIEKLVKLELQKGLRNSNRLSDISNSILEQLGDTFLSVNISDTDTLGNIGYKKYTDDSGRLIIKKNLKIDNTNNTYVDLDVKVNIVKI